VAALLIAAGAGSRPDHLRKAFWAAAEESHLDVFPILFSAGLVPGLAESAFLDDLAGVRYRLAEGDDPNSIAPDGRFVLEVAIRRSRREVLEALLDAGADARRLTDAGRLALFGRLPYMGVRAEETGPGVRSGSADRHERKEDC
jgi:hypothetical protein